MSFYFKDKLNNILLINKINKNIIFFRKLFLSVDQINILCLTIFFFLFIYESKQKEEQKKYGQVRTLELYCTQKIHYKQSPISHHNSSLSLSQTYSLSLSLSTSFLPPNHTFIHSSSSSSPNIRFSVSNCQKKMSNQAESSDS